MESLTYEGDTILTGLTILLGTAGLTATPRDAVGLAPKKERQRAGDALPPKAQDAASRVGGPTKPAASGSPYR